MRAGVIGLGAMGSGIASNLANAGLLSAVWNRTESKAKDFAAEHEVAVVDGPPMVAATVDVVIISVSADSDLLGVVEAMVANLGPGSVVVDTSTVAPATAREAAQLVRGAGAEFLDAPVSGGPEGAKQGSMVMMVGGDKRVLGRIQPVFEPICAAAHYMGPVGSGQATKAVNQIMVAGVMQGVVSGLAYGRAQGLDLDQVIEVLSGGAGSNWQLVQRGPNIARDQFPAGFKVALHRKDLDIVRVTLAEDGKSLDIIEQTLSDYDQLIEQGYADEDISALYRLRRRDIE